MEVDKKAMLDVRGRPLTQSLFLEMGYQEDFAIYTLKDWDWQYNGKTYPSIKRLYLSHDDPLEYDFATTYFLGWNHWLRLCENKAIRKFIDEWRTELELKLASQSIRNIIDMTADEKGFQAAKYVAERGWNKNPVGRPKKDTSDYDAKVEERLNEEFGDDVKRLKEKFGS
tara:strand:- start:2666 stop:3175 length:510 start_codon:yes stop_codon:yes gene_type:complete